MTRNLTTSLKALFCATALALCAAFFLATPDSANALSVRDTDVAEASQDNVMLGTYGTFSSPSKATILARINQIRKEAAEEGLVSEYVPMKWSSDLEWIAQTRAAEASICQDHNRPNGESCFSASHNGITSWAENLAWNYSSDSLMFGIEQWYEEKYDYVNKTGGVTGHYTSLINPKYSCIGIGCFAPSDGGWSCVAAELSFESGLDEEKSGVTGKYVQKIQVPKTSVYGIKLTNKTSMVCGTSATLSSRVVVRSVDYWGN